MEWNRDTIKKIRGLILFTVAAAVAGVNYERLWELLLSVFHMIWPFILGGAIAFILNVPMRRIEAALEAVADRKKKAHGILRPVSLTLTILLVAGILFLVTFVVGPQLGRTLFSLQYSIPAFLSQLQRQAGQLFSDNSQLVALLERAEIDWQGIFRSTAEVLRAGVRTMLNSTFSMARSVVNGVSTFLIAFIFAMYILLQKETLKRQAGMLLRAWLPEERVRRVEMVGQLTERIFSSFLTGQCLEAVILGTMFFVTLMLLRLPYALLIGVLIAFTALIPIFGAFIGLAVGAFLMLMTNPIDALIFTVAFFILQQIEGNLIYPRVVGGSVGLPSIWVLAAVTIGGSAMGIVGMLIFIPLCSVLYALLRENVHKRLRGKEESETEGESL